MITTVGWQVLDRKTIVFCHTIQYNEVQSYANIFENQNLAHIDLDNVSVHHDSLVNLRKCSL